MGVTSEAIRKLLDELAASRRSRNSAWAPGFFWLISSDYGFLGAH